MHNPHTNPKSYSGSLTFAEILQSIAGNELHIAGPAPLARLPYGEEMALKQAAFDEVWRRTKIYATCEPVDASPFSRLYRTTTKRKVVFVKGTYRLLMGDGFSGGPRAGGNEALLEPKQHALIYECLLAKINEPIFSAVAGHCNYVIIRGSYREFCVIFNMNKLDAAIVRKLKMLANHLPGLEVRVISVFIFLAPEKSGYFLDKKDREGGIKVKKLFGPDMLRIDVEGIRYLYDAVTFAQINQSMVPLLLKKTSQLLSMPQSDYSEMRLVDLYCGFGLFALYVGRNFSEVYGIDSEIAAINRARTSAQHLKNTSEKTKFRFLAGSITQRSLESILPDPGDMPEVIILDPPRSGAEKDVIQALALRRPLKVVHIFCNADILASELAQWKTRGYQVSAVAPLDMFPGTANLEVIVYLTQR